METTIQRLYKAKDVDMLIAAATIVQSAIANKAFLQLKRSTWADPFFEDLQSEITQAIQDHLGVDSARELRLATQAVVNIQSAAIGDLAEVKVQLTEDFKGDPTRRAEILNQLGFTAYHKMAQRGDQEALINLLYQFKTNIAQLRAEIIDKGTSETTLNLIIDHADSLREADIMQEGAKGTRRVITAEAITEFNQVYNKVISVSKIAANFYKNTPALKQQFSFKKVAKTINANRHNTPENN